MIYCRKKQEGDHFAIYDYGHDVNDLTGEVCFSVKGSKLRTDIIKQPEMDSLGEYGVSKVAYKYMNTMLNGVFPDKMAYERG